jgi:hypothetical protein
MLIITAQNNVLMVQVTGARRSGGYRTVSLGGSSTHTFTLDHVIGSTSPITGSAMQAELCLPRTRRQTNANAVQLAASDSLELARLVRLEPVACTTIVTKSDNSTAIALVEFYGLDCE